MVFGNLGQGSGTGVVITRNVSTAENQMEGDYLSNAQGEDVVAGTRLTKPIAAFKDELAKIYEKFERICRRLERHYRDEQDVEFTKSGASTRRATNFFPTTTSCCEM